MLSPYEGQAGRKKARLGAGKNLVHEAPAQISRAPGLAARPIWEHSVQSMANKPLPYQRTAS